MSVRVVAHVIARPDTIDATRKLLLNLIDPTRAEEGCVRYELLQNTSDPTDFTFVEEWSSSEALDTHLTTDHFQSTAAQGAKLFAAPPDIRLYRLVA